MEASVFIEKRAEYDECVRRGFEPLSDLRFTLWPPLRVAIQRELFGGHTASDNERFYRWVWRHRPHVCEETAMPLQRYSAVYISHILSRGAHPEMAHDPRNVNILCFAAHNQWENGDRTAMRIYRNNQRIIRLLKADYKDIL